MFGQLATIWKYKNFWLSLVIMDLRTRYRRSVLGIGWSLMNPLMMTVVFCVVFAKFFHNPDWRHSAPHFLGGMTLFEFIRGSALGGCATFFRNESYIRQYPLPLAIYTLRTVLGTAVHFMIAMGVVLASLMVLQPENAARPLAMLVVVLPSIVMLFLFCWSVAILASFMTVYFQDTQQLLEVVLQVFFFLTPIMFQSKMLIDRGLGVLLDINPAVTFLDLIRQPLLDGNIPAMASYLRATMILALFGATAIATTAKLEKRMIFQL